MTRDNTSFDTWLLAVFVVESGWGFGMTWLLANPTASHWILGLTLVALCTPPSYILSDSRRQDGRIIAWWIGALTGAAVGATFAFAICKGFGGENLRLAAVALVIGVALLVLVRVYYAKSRLQRTKNLDCPTPPPAL